MQRKEELIVLDKSNEINLENVNIRRSIRSLVYGCGVKRELIFDDKSILNNTRKKTILKSSKQKNTILKRLQSNLSPKYIGLDKNYNTRKSSRISINRQDQLQLESQLNQQEQRQQRNKGGIESAELNKKNICYFYRDSLRKLKLITINGTINNNSATTTTTTTIIRKFVYYESPIINLIKRNKLFLAKQNYSADESDFSNSESLTTANNVKNQQDILYNFTNMNEIKRKLRNFTANTDEAIDNGQNSYSITVTPNKSNDTVVMSGSGNAMSVKRKTVKKSFSPNNPCVLVQRSPNCLKYVNLTNSTPLKHIKNNTLNSSITDISGNCSSNDESFVNSNSVNDINLNHSNVHEISLNKENSCAIRVFKDKKCKDGSFEMNEKGTKKREQVGTRTRLERSNKLKKTNAIELPVTEKKLDSVFKHNGDLVKNEMTSSTNSTKTVNKRQKSNTPVNSTEKKLKIDNNSNKKSVNTNYKKTKKSLMENSKEKNNLIVEKSNDEDLNDSKLKIECDATILVENNPNQMESRKLKTKNRKQNSITKKDVNVEKVKNEKKLNLNKKLYSTRNKNDHKKKSKKSFKSVHTLKQGLTKLSKKKSAKIPSETFNRTKEIKKKIDKKSLNTNSKINLENVNSLDENLNFDIKSQNTVSEVSFNVTEKNLKAVRNLKLESKSVTQAMNKKKEITLGNNDKTLNESKNDDKEEINKIPTESVDTRNVCEILSTDIEVELSDSENSSRTTISLNQILSEMVVIDLLDSENLEASSSKKSSKSVKRSASPSLFEEEHDSKQQKLDNVASVDIEKYKKTPENENKIVEESKSNAKPHIENNINEKFLNYQENLLPPANPNIENNNISIVKRQSLDEDYDLLIPLLSCKTDTNSKDNLNKTLLDDKSKQLQKSDKREFSGTECLPITQKSPSTNSTVDSAKGSSIDVEMDFPVIIGDIFWARISSYPYWPCIVWPDQENRTVSVNFKNKNQKNQLKVHVRFFADNGRTSWVLKNNVIPYKGRTDFESLCEENSKKYNKKLCVLKGYTIPKNKTLWETAIKEADEILSFPLENRCLEFDRILNETRSILLQNKRKKRSSLSVLISSSDQFESYHRNQLNSSDILKKERSPTPESPAFEAIDDFQTFIERNRLESTSSDKNSHINYVEKMEFRENSNNSNLTGFNHNEYESFYEFLKSYILCGNKRTNDLLENDFKIYVQNLWTLKNISKQNSLGVELTSNNSIFNINCKSSRLLSSRMKKLSQQLFGDSSTSPSTSLNSINDQSTDESKIKKRRTSLKSRPIDEVVNDILELQKNYLFRGLNREPICKICKTASNLIKCSGNCGSWLHYACYDKNYISTQQNDENKSLIEQKETSTTINSEIQNKSQSSEITTPVEATIVCLECKTDAKPLCTVCQKNDSTLDELICCNANNCREYLHVKCLKYWPQAKIKKSSSAKVESLLCPRHTCHTCVCDDPRGKFLQISKSLAKCVQCLATYHLDSFCIPAGTQFLTATHIICPRHYDKNQKKIVNASWCFICAKGGKLICCDTCPTAFHLECLKITLQPDECYICEECETGRLPLYGELVWVKLSNFRWWPAIIIPPPEIPLNIVRIKHRPNEFCVRFFGSNDHAWVCRSKVFLYQEGDWGFSNNKNSIDNTYQKGLEEARRIFSILKTKRLEQAIDDKKKRVTPQPYVKIKSNRFVPPVKLQELDVSELTTCSCTELDQNPCGPNSDCLNRLLFTECNPKLCSAGEKCQNQMFESRLYPDLKISATENKGWSLRCTEPIKAGTFVIEYVGEVIDDAEFKRRFAQKQEERDENYYFLTVGNNYTIDAGPKGNLARFMNHSCEPNCETQKWTVNGITRIGLFAKKDIPANTELTFDYNLQCIGDKKKICNCGAEKCSGFIGVKYKERSENENEESNKKPKEEKKSRKRLDK